MSAAFFLNILVAQERHGILLLAHGSNDKKWEETVRDIADAVNVDYPLEIAFGMADPLTMQTAVDKLESEGVTTIVVVPLFISSHSPIIRQIEFLLGLRRKPADPPIIMQHESNGHSTNHSALARKVGLPPILPLRHNAKVILGKAMDDHPLIVEILDERIAELSREPTKETVILVAHGPNDEEDNVNWVKAMDHIAEQIQARRSPDMRPKNIFCVTVRDDAEKAIHDQAKENLRSLVRQAGKNGDVIVIPLFLAQGGVESRIVKRLEGLSYRWSGRTLLPHDNIRRFIEESVRKSLL